MWPVHSGGRRASEVQWLMFARPHADHFGGVTGVFAGRQALTLSAVGGTLSDSSAANASAGGWAVTTMGPR